ncbi:MAG: hypothetical protein NTV74_01750 [Euryarchaeota archaeon]|nr:hypothetical protein [Euryarchaeota archaeon]
MKWSEGLGAFNLMILLGFWLLFFSIFGVIFNKDWVLPILALFGLLFILTIIVILKSKKPSVDETIEEFEKTLEGGLYHFKCPNCNGIFAIKKSKHNNKKYFKMTCPDCGKVATVSPLATCVEEEIPEKKSVNVNFKCTNCGEGVTIWAEGADLYQDVCVYSCPYCGIEKTLDKV